MSDDGRLLSTALLERMAHDIRGPVGVVGFLLDELSANPAVAEPHGELIVRSRRSLQRLLNVADRLSRAALLESDGVELTLSRLEVRALIRDCVAHAQATEDRPEIVVKTAFAEQPVFADMDARWISAAIADTVVTFIRRARSIVEVSVAIETDRLRITLTHDGRRTKSEPDLFADLPIAMLAATARRHGWAIDIGPSQTSTDGLLQGGHVVLEIGAQP